MSPLQEESGCDEDEGEDEEEGREEEEAGFDSDESLVDSDSDSDEKGVFLTAATNKRARQLLFVLEYHVKINHHQILHNVCFQKVDPSKNLSKGSLKF